MFNLHVFPYFQELILQKWENVTAYKINKIHDVSHFLTHYYFNALK